MGTAIDGEHSELNSSFFTDHKLEHAYGYEADDNDSSYRAGTCDYIGFDETCNGFYQSTHLAGIIAGHSNRSGIQGIAYHAEIVAINIYERTVVSGESIYEIVSSDKIAKAVDKASSSRIEAMNNGWDISSTASFTETDSSSGSTQYHYKTEETDIDSKILTKERDAWEDAVDTTVVVFAAGDYGHNSENGMVKLYSDSDLTEYVEDRAWSDIAGGGGNKASAHARLPLTVTALQGGWLNVIALDEHNRIASFSNGCGDTKAYCLGAPGVDIYSAIPNNGYAEKSGTAQAAAHVSAAVAVLTDTFQFERLTPTDLVSIILETADDLGAPGVDEVYGHGIVNLARATEPIGSRRICLPRYRSSSLRNPDCIEASEAGITIDNSGITLPTSFGGALDGFTVGFLDDYNRAFIGTPARIAQQNIAFTLDETMATWETPELQTIALDSNSKMQFTNYDDDSDTKDTLMFTHTLPNHTIGFSYNEEHKTPDLMLAGDKDDLHFQKILPIAKDLMQVNSTYKLGKAWNVKNAITSGEFDTGNRFNEAMANLNYTGENRQLTIGAGTLKEYGQFLGASGTGAYQLSDATSSTVTHLAVTQNLPRNSSVKVKYTNFKTEVDMRYDNFAKINDLTADEYQLSLTSRQVFGKNDSLNLELIQPFAVTDGKLQQNTVLGYTAAGDYNNVTQNYSLAPETRRQQLRMTWQNQINLERKTRLFISMQYENHVDNLRDKEDKSILGGISTRF